MKRYLCFLPAAIFPYCVLFVMYCVFSGFLIDSLFEEQFFPLLLCLCVIWVLGLFLTALFLAVDARRKTPALTLARINMLVKLAHIPAYVVIFILGLSMMLTLFTMGISILLVVFDVMAIALSGLAGLVAVRRCRLQGLCSRRFAVLHGILQFVFCADVVSAIVVYRKARRAHQTDE